MTCEAFEDFRLGSVTLSRAEVEAIKNVKYEIPGRGENQEFKEKLSTLNIGAPPKTLVQRLVMCFSKS
jgi:hypothetical protein